MWQTIDRTTALVAHLNEQEQEEPAEDRWSYEVEVHPEVPEMARVRVIDQDGYNIGAL